MRELLRRCLAWGVLSALLLPMVLAVVLGLGGLLSSLGDAAGAAACGRIGLVVGLLWFVALAGTATVGGIVSLELVSVRPDRTDLPAPAEPPSPQGDQRNR